MTNRLSTSALPLASAAVLALFAFGCDPVEETDSADDVLDTQDLSMTVDAALDDINLDLEDEDASTVEDVADPESDAIDRPARRAAIRALILRAAESEPCAIRGILAGRYHAIDRETEIRADGVFRGRAWRRGRELAATGHGVYRGFDDAPGGEFLGEYENLDGDVGTVEGGWLPPGPESDRNFGTFRGLWTPDGADHRGGNIRGFRHPRRDGSVGVFIGYWSRCDMDRRHDMTEDEAS
jgi:hypothetical protein